MEMRSGPAAAIARTFFMVMPPETSTNARPPMSFTACLTLAGVILSRRMMSALPCRASWTSGNDSTSTITGLCLDEMACAIRQAVRTACFLFFIRVR